MTIKQQGGIFGRNPTFNDVTVDGTLTSASISVTALDDVTIGSSTPASGTFTDLAISQELEFQMSADAFGAGSSYAYILRTGSGGSAPFTQAGALVYQPRTSTTDGRSNHKFYTGDPLTLALDLKPNQNAHFGGNIVLPSGNGIDFSATSGTGTSELFDDYEEGTWTPTYSTTGTDFTSVTYDSGSTEGTYTKIGNMVNVRVSIRTDAVTIGSASGTVKINGLPFTASSNKNAVGCYGSLFSGDNPRIARAVSDSIFLYYRTSGNTADTPLAPADLGTGADNNDVIVSLCYQTS